MCSEVPRVREEALDQAGQRRALAGRQEWEHLRLPAGPAGPNPVPCRKLPHPGGGGLSDRKAVDAPQESREGGQNPLLIGVGEGAIELRGERLTRDEPIARE